MSSTITSPEDVNRLLFNLVRFEQQAPRFIEDAVKRIADEEILTPIKTKMKQKNYSQKIIDGTTIENIILDGSGFVQLDVISEYDTNEGFDVAKGREEGTTHPTPTLPRNPNGVLRWVTKTGEIIFRRKSYNKTKTGIKASHIIRDTVKSRFPILQQKLTDEIVEFYNRTVNA